MAPRPILIPNLTQGVSQQAPQHRRDSQCESQFDCINSLLDGCVPRPGFDFVARIAPPADFSEAFLHQVTRDGIPYLIGVNNATPIGINLLTGAELGFSTGSGDIPYLTCTPLASRDGFRAQTVEDVTFLINRTVAPAMDPGVVTAAPKREAIVFVRAAAFSTTYRVKVTSGANVAEVTYRTPKSTDNPDNAARFAKTDAIAEILRSGQNASYTPYNILRLDVDQTTTIAEYNGINGTAGFTCDRYGSILHIYRADNADFTIETEDSGGDDYLYSFKGFVPNYSRLPKKGVTGVKFKVQGEERTKDDDYYVVFEGAPTTGTWIETVGTSQVIAFDPETMPHVFTWLGTDNFLYGPTTWSNRVAGDTDIQPDPSFIGKTLRDVFWHEQRLGLLTEATVVWSKSRFPYTFFHDTAQILLATAPVDARVIAGAASDGGTVIPDFAVGMGGNLFLWGPGSQFLVSSGQEPFKPDTVKVDLDTAYDYTASCDPTAVGTFLFFATGSGQWSSIRAIRFEQGRAGGDLDITAHVPTYVPLGARRIVASDTLRYFFVQTDGDTSKLYMWNFLFADNAFAQSAWNTWRLPPGELLWVGLKENTLRILMQREDGVVLLKMDLTPRAVDAEAGSEYLSRLDMRVSKAQCSSVTYNAVTDRTSFTLPYTPTDTANLRVIIAARPGSPDSNDPAWDRGYMPEIVSVVGAVVTIKGKATNFAWYCGYRIVSERTESEFFHRTEDGPVPYTRMTLTDVALEVSDTAYTRLEVYMQSRDMRAYEYHGRHYVDVTMVTGGPVPSNGTIRAPLGEAPSRVTLRLVNDTPYPSSWSTLSYMLEGVGRVGHEG